MGNFGYFWANLTLFTPKIDRNGKKYQKPIEMLKKLKKGSKVVKSVKNVKNGPKWAPKAPRVAKISKIVGKSLIYFKNISKVLKMCKQLIYFKNFQIFHCLPGQAGGWPIGRLTSLLRKWKFYAEVQIYPPTVSVPYQNTGHFSLF